MRDFDEWLSKFRASISSYDYYIDFEKVVKNVEEIKVELNILNTLIGSKNIEEDFEKIMTKYPETLQCIPLLLAVRGYEIYAQDEDGAFLYLFLRTKVGEALIKRQACGNSIPRVWEPHISRLRVLWPEPAVRKSFAKPVIEAHEMIEQARQAELKAVRLLEQKIKGGT